MRILFWAIAIAILLPIVAIAAIALAPADIGVLCAAGFGLIVYLFIRLFVLLGSLFERHEHRRYVLSGRH